MTAVEFSGNFSTEANADTVVAFITSHASLVTILPDVESHKLEDGVSVVKFKLDLEKFGNETAGSYLSTATATMRFEIDQSEAGRVVIRGKGRALGSSLKTRVSMEVKEAPCGSDVIWQAEVDAGLLLRLIGKSTTDAYSADIVAKIIDNLRTALH